MVIGALWGDAYLEPQKKEKYSVMFINKLPKNHQNKSNLKNCLESNQCIDGNRWNHKNRHPRHDLPQSCGGVKSVCPVWIWPTENLQSRLRESFRINEHWYNKYDTHNFKINKISSNQLKRTSLNTQPSSLPLPSTKLRGNQIHMSDLDTSHRYFSIIPEDKFRYQWTLIRSMQEKQVENKWHKYDN